MFRMIQKPFALSCKMPPWQRLPSLHETLQRHENIEHTGVLALSRHTAKLEVHLFRIPPFELAGFFDPDKAQVQGYRFSDVGKIGQKDEAVSRDFPGVHAFTSIMSFHEVV
jgi:hypothetical protein